MFFDLALMICEKTIPDKAKLVIPKVTELSLSIDVTSFKKVRMDGLVF